MNYDELMKNLSPDANDVYEYILVLTPHKEMWEAIIKEQDHVEKLLGEELPARPKPHITLVNFVQIAKKENEVIKALQFAAEFEMPFKITVKDYNSIPANGIGMMALDPERIKMVVDDIKKRCDDILTMNDDNQPYYFDNFYIRLVNKLSNGQLKVISSHYRKKKYTGRFIAIDQVLLKRRCGTNKYSIVDRFEMNNSRIDYDTLIKMIN